MLINVILYKPVVPTSMKILKIICPFQAHKKKHFLRERFKRKGIKTVNSCFLLFLETKKERAAVCDERLKRKICRNLFIVRNRWLTLIMTIYLHNTYLLIDARVTHDKAHLQLISPFWCWITSTFTPPWKFWFQQRGFNFLSCRPMGEGKFYSRKTFLIFERQA